MNQFQFLDRYIDQLPEEVRKDPYLGYALRGGASEDDIRRIESETNITVPDELKEFYRFSYGAFFGEYKILTLNEIENLLGEMR